MLKLRRLRIPWEAGKGPTRAATDKRLAELWEEYHGNQPTGVGSTFDQHPWQYLPTGRRSQQVEGAGPSSW
jgi:hypothetical protein